MMLRVVLAVLLLVTVGLSGCKKEEPSIGDQLNQAQKEAEDAAEDLKDAADDAADEAKEAMEQ